MITITVGNPASFAIESGLHKATARLSQRALGYFIIHINGRCYGVKAWDATMLGCSFYTVLDRIAERGTHTAPFMEASAVDLIDAYLEVCYIGDREHELFFGQTPQSLSKILFYLAWAQDGDAAFDDGSHVLQFDIKDRVRLIAVTNRDTLDEVIAARSEIWLDADEYYGILAEWALKFQAARIQLLRSAMAKYKRVRNGKFI